MISLAISRGNVCSQCSSVLPRKSLRVKSEKNVDENVAKAAICDRSPPQPSKDEQCE